MSYMASNSSLSFTNHPSNSFVSKVEQEQEEVAISLMMLSQRHRYYFDSSECSLTTTFLVQDLVPRNLRSHLRILWAMVSKLRLLPRQLFSEIDQSLFRFLVEI
ncbi:zinc finger protein ZAT9-like [Senna tora]|uniref:Zinc finger protein ZAT9-like n=1 Tax=Senna tora TaxID=362788 RepID=A0A834TS71_9FABA|nr:zinc finger protein ZAT9-like [Senna tora]